MSAPYNTAALNAAQKRLETALDRVEADRVKLYREDGSPLYSAKEMQERQGKLAAMQDQAIDSARKDSQAIVAAADATLLALTIDPLLQLTNTAEREEVSYKQPLIAEGVQLAALPELASQLAGIALHGSKAEKLLYMRYATARVANEWEAAVKANVIVAGLKESRDALNALKASVGDDRQEKKRVSEAAKLEAQRFALAVSIRASAVRHETADLLGAANIF